MDPVTAAVRDWLRRHGRSTGRLTVACSGGADSLALAGALIGVVGPDRAAAVTVDHQLQPGSAAQARRVGDQLRGLGYRSVEIRPVDVGTQGGPEAAARVARYLALTPDDPAEPVLLAHTADDQAETVLLGLSRGSGPRSIAGMRPWAAPWGRPLLSIRRSATESYCRSEGLDWWNDPHNLDPGFVRVRLRREVLPLLEDVLGGGVGPALARTAELMAEDLEALDWIAARTMAGRFDDGQLDLDRIAEVPPGVRRRVLRAWAAAAGVRGLTHEHLRRLDDLACGVGGYRTGSSVRLPGPVDAIRTGSRLAAQLLN